MFTTSPLLILLLCTCRCSVSSVLNSLICTDPDTCDWILPLKSSNAFGLVQTNKADKVVFTLLPDTNTTSSGINYDGVIASIPLAVNAANCHIGVTLTFFMSEILKEALLLQVQIVSRTGIIFKTTLNTSNKFGRLETITTFFNMSGSWPFIVSLKAAISPKSPEPQQLFTVYNITLGGCDIVKLPREAMCTFDHDVNGTCGWTNMGKNVADWLRHQGDTPTRGTGPSIDHTFSSNQSYYMYIESHGPIIEFFTRLRLRSKTFPAPPEATLDPNSPDYGACSVSFAYHRWGSRANIARLTLHALKVCVNEFKPRSNSQIWSSSKKRINHRRWNLVRVPLLNVNTPFYLRFDGEPRNFERGDLAIDDILLSPQCFGIGLQSSTRQGNISANISHIISNLSPSLSSTFYSNDEAQVCELYQKIAVAAVTSFSFQTIQKNRQRNEMEFVLMSCGARGRFGPTQAQCDRAYKDSTHKVRVIENGLWKGVQVWTVLETAEYLISAKGAHGGTSLTNFEKESIQIGYVVGNINLTKGEDLYILVAQPGEDACSDGKNGKSCYPQNTDETWIGGGGGGGGASFVFKVDNETGVVTLLMVASGSHGYSVTTNKSTSFYVDQKTVLAGRGGGYNTTSARATDGQSLLDGGIGGEACAGSRWPANGGFGGGGGACTNGGGAGGFFGGLATGSATSGGNYISPLAKRNMSEKIELWALQAEVAITRIIPCPCEFHCRVDDTTTGAFTCFCDISMTLAADGISCIRPVELMPTYASDEGKTESGAVDPDAASISVGVIVSTSVAGILICTFAIAFLLFCRYWRQHKRTANLPMKADLFQMPPGQILPSDSLRPSRRVQYNTQYFVNQDLQPVPREMLVLLKPLGQGAFGLVYHGVMLKEEGGADKQEYQVAIKTLPEHSTEQAEMDFLMEAMILSKFNHDNIVHFIGVCFDMHPRYIVLELLEGGDLKSFLREYRNKHGTPDELELTMKDLIMLALNIAHGCRHLEENHFIHRDVAARNCLLTSKTSNRIAKIADFGMSRDIYRADYYKKGGKAVLPVKWMPPEAFMDGIFTTKTDVWSFGVLLWEVFSMGLMPYPWLGNYEVMEFVVSGGRMELPENCAPALYGLMLLCWDSNAENRPTFSMIIDKLTNFLQDEEILSRELPMYKDYRLKRKLVSAPTDNACTMPEDIPDESPVQQELQGSSSQCFITPAITSSGSTIPLLASEDDPLLIHSKNTVTSSLTQSHDNNDVPDQAITTSTLFGYQRIPTSDYDLKTLDSPNADSSEKPAANHSSNSYINDLHFRRDGIAETTFTDLKPIQVDVSEHSLNRKLRDVASVSLEQLPRKKCLNESLKSMKDGETSVNMAVTGSLKTRPRSSSNVDNRVSRSFSDKSRSKKQMYDVNNYLVPRKSPYDCDMRVNMPSESYSPLLEDCEKDKSEFNADASVSERLLKDSIV